MRALTNPTGSSRAKMANQSCSSLGHNNYTITTLPQSLDVECGKDMMLWYETLPKGIGSPLVEDNLQAALQEMRAHILPWRRSGWFISVSIMLILTIILQERRCKIEIALTLVPDIETWLCSLLWKLLNFSVSLILKNGDNKTYLIGCFNTKSIFITIANNLLNKI